VARIDLNADLGEGFGRYRLPHEDALLDLVTSANVACGFHAGDPVVMRETVAAASRRGVAVGAHPGYPDLAGFGRRDLSATPAEIIAIVIYQIGALAAVCRAEGTRLRYVKPHGALYNRAARDRAAAEAIAEAVRSTDPSLILLGLAGSELVHAARDAGLATAEEAFADRAYEPDGSLTPRGEPDAVLADPAHCADRAARMALDGIVTTSDGSVLEIAPDSICVHGDGPAALAVLTAVHDRLRASGVEIRAFAP
jgi:5-oxoprolinase (ATP-hydrolysing) subunit A